MGDAITAWRRMAAWRILLPFLAFILTSSNASSLNFGHVRHSGPRPSHIKTPVPEGPPPPSFHWGEVDGVNYLTQAKNQHIPQYCGSCWAQAATSSLSDRIKIARKAAWPDINIAPQVLISCGPMDGCHGGDAGVANKRMADNGITDETCAIYVARGHDNGMPCSKVSRCETCWPETGCYLNVQAKIEEEIKTKEKLEAMVKDNKAAHSGEGSENADGAEGGAAQTTVAVATIAFSMVMARLAL